MSEDTEEISKAGGMKAMQILQTLMIAAILGGGTILGGIIMADHRLLASMEERQKQEGEAIALIHGQVEKLQDKGEALDRRVTIIETRVR